MKITKKQLAKIIREEMNNRNSLNEAFIPNQKRPFSPMRSRAIPEFAAAIKGNNNTESAVDVSRSQLWAIIQGANQDSLSESESNVVGLFSGDQEKQNAVEKIARAMAARAEEMLDADGDGDDVAVHVDHKLFLSPYTDFDGHKGEVPALADHVYNSYISGKSGDQAHSLEDIIERIGIDYFDEDIEYALEALGDDRWTMPSTWNDDPSTNRFDNEWKEQAAAASFDKKLMSMYGKDSFTEDEIDQAASAAGYSEEKIKAAREKRDQGQMMTSPVSGDSDEDWIYDLEGEIEAKMQGIESGEVVELEPDDDIEEDAVITEQMLFHWYRIAGVNKLNEQSSE